MRIACVAYLHGEDGLKMKKVLIVGISETVGGIETLMYNIFGDVNSIVIDFITFDRKCAFEDELRKNGHQVYHLPPRKEKLLAFDSIVKGFFRKHNDYDYIWINTSSNSMYQFQVYGKKLTRAKIITHSHGTKAYQGRLTITSMLNATLNSFNRKIVRNHTDIYIGCSKAAGEALFGKEIGARLVILNNGIATEKFKFDEQKRKNIRCKLNIGSDTLLVGMIGRLSSQKNPIRGIQIFESILRMNEKSVLVVVGDGELRNDINTFIVNKKLYDNVLSLGVRKDIPDLLCAIDVLIMPSLFEGLPVVAIEAQCAGVKCFLSDEITDEVSITDLVRRLPLKKSNDEWANEIISSLSVIKDRADYSSLLKEKGYDIEDTRRRALSIVS